MNFEELRRLAELNEVRIDDHLNFRRSPPYYYDFLRLAFGYYFNTFQTNNHVYEVYAQGLALNKSKLLSRQFLDEENTTSAITSFSHFFESFLKHKMARINRHLNHIPLKRLKEPNPITDLVDRIENGNFEVKTFDNKPLSIPLRETINRFYDLRAMAEKGSDKKMIKKFARASKKYSFIFTPQHKSSLQVLNWYRDRLLHRGNKLPSLWYLDFFVTQRILPIVFDIISTERENLGDSLFYLETVTKIDLLRRMTEIRFDYKDLKSSKTVDKAFHDLLHIGHLKELGRANLNMNLFVRLNQATYEYSYKDPKGRGRRFAQVELAQFPDAKEVKSCPCCGEISMVLYRMDVLDFFNLPATKQIEWVKCYTCEYHIRSNVGDPFIFGLTTDRVFSTTM